MSSSLSHFCVPTEALIAAINNDIEEAKVKLELPEHLKLREDNFFTSLSSSSSALPATTASTSQTIMNGHWQLAVTVTHTHTHHNTHRCMHSLKCTASFWDLLSVVMAVLGHNDKQPIFFYYCVFLLQFLISCMGWLQTVNHFIVYIHTRLPHLTASL